MLATGLRGDRQNGSQTSNNGDGDTGDVIATRKLTPPFTDLFLVSQHIPYSLIRHYPEVAVSDLLSGSKESLILIDAGNTKVQSRLYGGVFPDWRTGGMWKNTSNFIGSLNKFAKDKKYQLLTIFDSSIDSNNLNAWLGKMEGDYDNIKHVFDSARSGRRGVKGMAHLWYPPTSLQTSLRLICLTLGIKVHCTLYEHEPELVAVPDLRDPRSESLLNKAGAVFTNSLEYFCYSDLELKATFLWGESLKLNMRGDRMSGKVMKRDDIANALHIRSPSLDAGLLYYGSRYFLDVNDFDPIPDLHQQLRASLKPGEEAPAKRVVAAISLLKQVHEKGVNTDNGQDTIGDSLVPNAAYIRECLKKGSPLPPHFAHITSGKTDRETNDLIDRELSVLCNKASEVFYDVGKRLLEGRVGYLRPPYFTAGHRVSFPHQRGLQRKFIEQIESLHRGGLQHEWVAHLVCAQIPTIRIAYTAGDRGCSILKWKEDPKEFFRDIRRRSYGLLFGIVVDHSADSSSESYPVIREIFYPGVDTVHPIPLTSEITSIATSSQALWKISDRNSSLVVLLRLVMGNLVPAHWEKVFPQIPDWAWIPVLALRYMIERSPAMFANGYLDAILATIAVVGNFRFKENLDKSDQMESERLHVTEQSITFASYFMSAVDHVVFANDVVGGAAVPVNEVNPCFFFDGGVFNTKLMKRQSFRSDSRRGLEDLLGFNDTKMALFLKIRSCALDGLTEKDLETVVMDPEPETITSLVSKNMISTLIAAKPLASSKRSLESLGGGGGVDNKRWGNPTRT